MRIEGTARTVTAGGTVGYAATGLDGSGRPIVDLTSATTFRITATGPCAGSLCTATRAGSYTVVGTVTIPDGTFRGSTTLRVVPGPIDRLSLIPRSASLVAGRAVTFRASGADAFGNSLGDVTSSTSFTMPAPGRCIGAACTATKAADYTVRGTAFVAGRAITGAATLVVLPGPVDVLAISPPRARAQAGQTANFRAQSVDAYGNPVADLTDQATFTMTAPGSCTGGSCSATQAQAYAVSASVVAGGVPLRGVAVLDVAPGPQARLLLDPPSAVATPGRSITFRAYGSDAYGNQLGEVTGLTTVGIGPDGTCTGRSCSASGVGPHEVTASATLVTGTATAKAKVLVVGTDIVGLRLNPRSAQIRTDQKATFSAVGVDGNGNVVTDLTGYAVFGISPDGQCSASACTARQLGMHSVRGTLATPEGTVTDEVPVELVPKGGVADQAPGEIAAIQVSPKIAQADAGAAITYIATGVDANGTPVADLTDQTTFAMLPDGSCAGPSCVATTPGPHTVTGTFNGVPATAGAKPSGVTVSRSALRTPPRAVAAQILSAEASLDVTAGPGSCLVSTPDLTTLTATTQPVDDGGAAVRVDGIFAARFATCPVVVLFDGKAVQDVTRIRQDGTIVATTTIPQDSSQRTGTAEVIAIDGRAIKQVAYTVPVAAAAGANWLLWLLLALALIAAGIVANSARDRRQRRWVAQHVVVAPVPSQGRVSTSRDPDSGPSLGIRLVPRSEPGTIHISTEEDR